MDTQEIRGRLNNHQCIASGFSTKMQIVAAFEELSKSASFESIKIQQVCELADISRSTFYHHFKDRNDVLEWHSLYAYAVGIDCIGRFLNWFEGHLITTKVTDQYRNLYYRAGYLREYSAIRPVFFRHRVETLRETVIAYQKRELTPTIDFQILAIAGMEEAVANLRYGGELDLTPRQYASYLETVVPRELYEITKDPVQPRDDKTGISFPIVL